MGHPVLWCRMKDHPTMHSRPSRPNSRSFTTWVLVAVVLVAVAALSFEFVGNL